MDVEARRKYCGLLMFPPTPSRNNDITINNMSMREVDPSSSTYESSRIMMNDHQFVMQDGFGEFSSSRALAAGAAAGGDLINQENLDAPNVIDGDTSTSNSKSQPAKRTPRPPNAFILYRRAKQPGIIASQRNLTNAEVSRTISDMWRKEPEEIRLEWERYADRKKLEHMQTYPNYVYRPNKNKSKVDKRRQQRKQSTKESTSSNNNNNNNNNNSLVENKSSNPGPVRRRSTKNVNNKPPTKLDLPLSMNGMAGFNQQQNSNNDTSNSYTTILPSPEIPLLSAHYTENPGEFISSNAPITPITPLTPPENENDYKLLHELTYQQQQQQQQQQHHHHHQGNTQHFSFQPIPLTHYTHASNQTVDQLDFCFVPDVEQQQQQMIAEMMLHHEQHHHITPTATVPSSNPTQYYANSGSFTEMLGFEFPFLGGSVSHNGNGLDSSDQYL
ncbi:hypothetical protein RclHR1_04620008 [Rhizophagus clarus]|uniref:Mating-type HMG-box protein MAT1-2 n=1 Tax=Rhizophagus clarus TaxID=94130 RepID=A0A2Z6RJW7_9GLOM|nr:hypothetical protein RclHR1_04620008 [Rhizophagus clarus]GES95260.1 mating-type HMG-box protein MAT1-2 [Rhizophagus clarus]